MQVLHFCIYTTLVVAAWSRGMILPLGGSGLGFDSRSGPFFFVPFLFVRLRDEIDAYGRQLSIALIFLLQRAILKVH